jgi:hypothetical protein
VGLTPTLRPKSHRVTADSLRESQQEMQRQKQCNKKATANNDNKKSDGKNNDNKRKATAKERVGLLRRLGSGG